MLEKFLNLKKNWPENDRTARERSSSVSSCGSTPEVHHVILMFLHVEEQMKLEVRLLVQRLKPTEAQRRLVADQLYLFSFTLFLKAAQCSV